MLIVDRDNRILYELWQAGWNSMLGRWEAGSGAIFQLDGNGISSREALRSRISIWLLALAWIVGEIAEYSDAGFGPRFTPAGESRAPMSQKAPVGLSPLTLVPARKSFTALKRR